MGIKACMEGEKLNLEITLVECGVIITYIDSTEKIGTALGLYSNNGKIVKKEL